MRTLAELLALVKENPGQLTPAELKFIRTELANLQREKGETAEKSVAPLPQMDDAGRQVIEWMIEGRREPEIAALVAANFPATDPKSLIEQAGDHFERAAHCQPEVITGWAMEAYRALYRRLLEMGDYHGAMKAVASLQKLASELPPEEDEEETAP